MDEALRLAWTEIVTPSDYEEHMANVGQAQAAAALTSQVLRHAALPAGSHLLIAAAGTGQMLEYLDPSELKPLRLTCSDINSTFLALLKDRLQRLGLQADVRIDDIEHSTLPGGADLFLATLLLEHIDWRKGIDAIVGLSPAIAALIIQENPPGMESAVTPGRAVPRSLELAMRTAHPKLVKREELVAAFAGHGYVLDQLCRRNVADGKALTACVFQRVEPDPAEQGGSSQKQQST